MSQPTLPRVPFAGRQVSRMLLGGNPFSGFGHHPELPDFDRELLAYFTDEKILETMTLAVRNGINAFHGRGDEKVFRWLANYRAWAASQPDRPELNWLAQTAPDRYPDGRVEPNIEAIAANQPMAIYIHGGTSDTFADEGRVDELKRLVAYIKSLGFFAGLGSHRASLIRLFEERDFGADFYILSLRDIPEEDRVCEDERAAALTIREVPKTFVAIKVLAAGRLPVAEAFQYAARTLKPGDLMTVGMRDYEVVTNVRLAAQAFADAGQDPSASN